MPDFARIILMALGSFAFLFLISKIMGKKQISQLEFIDYVIGISLGSIAANMATETEQPFYHYLIGMSVFLLLDLFINIISRKSVFFKKVLKGKPLIIIDNGKIDYKTLKKSRLDVNDVSFLARNQGYFSLTEIAFAIYEVNGTMSFLPTAENKKVTALDLDLHPAPPELEYFLVVDGKITEDGVGLLGKTEQWLIDGLHIKNDDDLKNIMLAIYDKKTDNFVVHYKNLT